MEVVCFVLCTAALHPIFFNQLFPFSLSKKRAGKIQNLSQFYFSEHLDPTNAMALANRERKHTNIETVSKEGVAVKKPLKVLTISKHFPKK